MAEAAESAPLSLLRVDEIEVEQFSLRDFAFWTFSAIHRKTWNSMRISTLWRASKEFMKKLILSMALAVAAPFAWAQVSETTTTTTTEGTGTITEYSPGTSIVLKETAGPRTYRFGKKVVYVTRSGKELDEATVRTRVRVGAPVRVHYVNEGDNMLVDRVILDED
jgi:hypothetical protein